MRSGVFVAICFAPVSTAAPTVPAEPAGTGSDSLVPFRQEKKWGFADRFVDGLARVEREGRWGYVDTTGAAAIPCRYQRLESTFADGLAYVSRRLRPDLPHFATGWIDRNGREYFDESPLFGPESSPRGDRRAAHRAATVQSSRLDQRQALPDSTSKPSTNSSGTEPR